MSAEGKRAYWGIVAPVMPAGLIADSAKQAEQMGLHGVFAAQVYGPPWTALAAAATGTSTLQLASGIAQCFVRSPFETAMAAMDLDRISGGRFILGLGPTVRSWSEGLYGVPGYGKPLEHLREAVEVTRLIMSKSHTGELTHFRGKYYTFDWTEFQGSMAPVRTNLPIWLAAVRGPSIELACEISEGLVGHPIWSVNWATRVVPQHLKAGLARAGKQREDVHVCVWFWVTPNIDAKESVNDARACVAFYAGVEQYESYFAAHGFGAEAKQLQAGVKHGDYRSVAHQVPDEMASTFVVTGTPDEVRRKVEPVWEVADSVLLVPPLLTIEPEKSAQYFGTIAQTFYF
jgi:alkanesulfonate monooxygenase SsuD/methylene tetrahydromethanopterin reductase-like flavin-dependent oxidoreductase (luciferase family)